MEHGRQPGFYAFTAGISTVVTDRFLIADEVGEGLGVPVSWVRESARSGEMPCVRLGRYVRFDLADVEAWIESCKQPGRSTRLRSHDAANAADGGTR
jgi:excisionase family DNA binding protein